MSQRRWLMAAMAFVMGLSLFLGGGEGVQTVHADPATDPVVHIVEDGQGNAVVVSRPGTVSTDAPEWAKWGDAFGTVARSDAVAHSGYSSLLLDGFQQGGVYQDVSVQPGPVTLKVYYYTEAAAEGKVRVTVNLRNAAKQTLTYSHLDSTHLSLPSTSGQWELIALEGVIPEEAAGQAVAFAQVSVTVQDTLNTSVYFDDFELVQSDDQNLVKNPGFEMVNIQFPAADRFVEYVEKSTGVKLPILAEAPLNYDGVTVYIGHSREQDEARHQAELDDLNEHGFIIDAQEDNVTIVGTTERATLFGVLEFLERYAGIRWLMPGAEGEHVPQWSTLAVPLEFVREEPATISRHFFTPGSAAMSAWLENNRMHHNIQFHHNMHVLFDPEVFADHPEYYADGVVPTDLHSWQPCFNSATANAAIQRIIEYFTAHPEATSYSLGINDGPNYCEDPGHPDYPTETNSVGRLNRSDLYYRWVNQIAEGVTAVFPDKYFGLLAYREMYEPPKQEDGTPLPLHPNVIPYITHDRMSWIDPDVKQTATQNIEAWNQSASNIGLYDYMYGAFYSLPRMYLQQMDENYKYGADHYVIGHVAELYPNFGGEGPKAWISAKLQWDPTRDVDELLQDWYVSAVGADAAPYLQQYFEYWEDFWTVRMRDSTWFNKHKGSTYLAFDDLSYLLEVTEQDLDISRQLLEQAVELAPPGPQKTRAEKFLQAFEYYEASVLSYPVTGDVDVPANETEALQMLDRVIQSYEMGEKRKLLPAVFESDPILRLYGDRRGNWDGILSNHIAALEAYAANEPEGGIVGELLRQFLDQIGYSEVFAKAVKMTAGKEEIVQTLDFSQWPWTDAEPFNNFRIMNTDDDPPVETKVRLLWDDENLYVGYENFDDDPSQMIVSADAPGGWWSSGYDDSVETYVTGDPGGSFLGFFSNPAEVSFARTQADGYLPDTVWSVSANVESDRWNTIQVIPFATIGVDPNEMQTLQGFFFRNYRGNSAYIGWDGGAPWKQESFRPVYLVGSRSGVKVALDGAPNPVEVGQQAVFTASVTPSAGGGTPTGEVALWIDDSLHETKPLDVAGSAEFFVALSNAGEYEVKAVYGGDEQFENGESAPFTLQVVKTGGTTVVLTGVSEAVYGDPVTLQVAVAGEFGSENPTGMVTLVHNGQPIESKELDSEGHASFVVSGLDVGTHLFKAAYEGDGRYGTAESAEFAVIVFDADADATISSLAVSTQHHAGIALTPAFSPSVYRYEAAVDHGTDAVRIATVTSSVYAQAYIQDVPVISGEPTVEIPLSYGSNEIIIRVVAQNGEERTYSVVILRALPPSTDARLAGLTLSHGSLSPSFSAETTEYTAVVPYSTEAVTITPIASHEAATIRVNGDAVASGQPSAPIALDVGANLITVEVTAEDGEATAKYTISLTRRARELPNGTGSGNAPPAPTRQVIIKAGDGDELVESVEMVRTIGSSGEKIDTLILQDRMAADMFAKAAAAGLDAVKIIMDDAPEDAADEIEVRLPIASLEQMSGQGIALVVQTPDATLTIPAETLEFMNDDGRDLYFRIMPIARPEELAEAEERAVHAELVQEAASGPNATVIGKPMKIETNYAGGNILVEFPLTGVELPEDDALREAFAAGLAIYIEHSDGENALQRGTIKYDEQNRSAAIEIRIDKFSTFTMVRWDATTLRERWIYGYEDGTFRPEQTVTRAETAELLRRIIPVETDAAATYVDVAPNHWAADALSAAAASGLMTGDADGRFRPEDALTRAEAAKIVALAAGLDPAAGGKPSFADAGNHWAAPYIAAAEIHGFINGYGDGSFRPDRGVTRAEMVKLLHKLKGLPEPEYADTASWRDVPPEHWAFRYIEAASNTYLALPLPDGKERIIERK